MPTKLDIQSQYALEMGFHKNFIEQSVTYTPYASNSSPAVWTDNKTGDTNPKWREMIARGENATTNYSFYRRKAYRLQSEGVVHMWDRFGRYFTGGWMGHPQQFSWSLSSASGYSEDSADYRARRLFMQKYRGLRTAFQGGIFLGELKQTIEMIRRPASALRDGIDRYHGAVNERLRRAKYRRFVIQDTWLEYVFGWKPLISDAEDACRIATASPFLARKIISKQAGTQPEDIRTKIVFGRNGCRATVVKRSYVDIRVKYKGAIAAKNSPPPFPEQLGFSWSNVLPTAWELIPYSFLFDYFTNIGVVVEGISTGTIHLDWGYKGVTKERTISVENCEFDQAYLNAQIPAGGSGHGSATMHDQTLETATNYSRLKIDNVSIGLRDFRFKMTTDSKHWLNIAALAKLRFLRQKPKGG